MKHPYFLLLLFVFVSCKSVNPSLYTLHRDSVAYTLHQTIDTIVQRDSIFMRDSVVYRERTIHDTVYVTKEVYRDTHNSSLISRNSTQADTVRVVEYRDRVVDHPPERYIPSFHKWCTILFWVIVAGVILYYVLKIGIRLYLKK